MIGQIKYAWLSFVRTIKSSVSHILSLILAYFIVSTSINIKNIIKSMLYWTIPYNCYLIYKFIAISFMIFCFLSGIIILFRTVNLTFDEQKNNIALIKNIGGKNLWIYSYTMTFYMFMTLFAMIIGLFTGGLLLIIILYLFKLGAFVEKVDFFSAFLSSALLIIAHYIAVHRQLMKFIHENEFIRSTKGLSSYKSIFELDNIIYKFKTEVKIAFKIVLRSNNIILTSVFIFFISSTSIFALIGPMLVKNKVNYDIQQQYSNVSYVIGTQESSFLFNKNIGLTPYNNTKSLCKDIINKSVINYLSEKFNISSLFISKIPVNEINKTIAIAGTANTYRFIGRQRSINATIVGYTNSSFLNNRIIEGQKPIAKNEVLIGETLNNFLFDNSSEEHLTIQGISKLFSVSGIVRDFFANGFTIYIPLHFLIDNKITSGVNIIEIKNTDVTQSYLLKLLKSLDLDNYSVLDINTILSDTLARSNYYLNFLNIIGLVDYFIVLVLLFIYSYLIIAEYFDDITLFISIGIPNKKIQMIYLNSVVFYVSPVIVMSYLLIPAAFYYLIYPRSFIYFISTVIMCAFFEFLICIFGSVFKLHSIFYQFKQNNS